MKYLIKRILYSIPVIILVSIMVFMFIHMIPGDPIRILLGVRATPEKVEFLTNKLNLDKPIIVQYFIWIKNLINGDFGTSIRTEQPVLEMIVDRTPVTFSLTTYAILIAMITSIAAGVIAGANRNSSMKILVNIYLLIY